MARKNLGDAFGGKITTREKQRAIWLDALHEDAIWEGPTFELPVLRGGRAFLETMLGSLLNPTRGLRGRPSRATSSSVR